jgi:hypothetical protein
VEVKRGTLDKEGASKAQSSVKEGEGSMGENSLLERVTAAAEERHLSQNTLTAYRRT